MNRFPRVTCGTCHGEGVVPLSGVYLETWRLLNDHGETHGAALARLARCQATTMNNRLRALEKHGLASSRVVGRKRLYRARHVIR